MSSLDRARNGTSASVTPTQGRTGLVDRFAAAVNSVPWWARVLVVFVLSRIVSTAMLLSFAAHQVAAPGWVTQQPNLIEYSNLWDGQWYWRIALYGYPSMLPVNDFGQVTESAWAFMPVYPMFVRGLSFVTTIPWPVMAPLVSVAFGLATCLLLYKLFRRYLSDSQALFAILLYCISPVSPMLQVSYAESMGAFFITLALWLLVQRRYGWLFAVVPVMALTRPLGLAFALMLGLLWLLRFARRKTEPFPVRERITTVALGFYTVGWGFLWPAVAWIGTGSFTAYTDTELAWRRPYIGEQHLVPFTAWFQGANWWIGAPWGAIILVAVIALCVASFWLPQMRRLGIELRLWVASYGIYLLAVFFPQSSTFRMLMPMFPALGAIAQPKSPIYRSVVVVLCLIGQWVWLSIGWAIDPPDWTPP